MNRNMTMVFIVMLVFVSGALGQANVCTYPFDMGTFQFCISQNGTLFSMKLPGGSNLINPERSDGFGWFFEDFQDDFVQSDAFPPSNCNLSSTPGTLPLTFHCIESQGITFDISATANAPSKTVTFTLGVSLPCFSEVTCTWHGVVFREAQFTPVQLGNTRHSTFAWAENALMLTAACPRHAEPDYGVAESFYDSNAAMDLEQGRLHLQPNSIPNTPGSIAAFCRTFSQGGGRVPTMKFTYRIPPSSWGF